MSRPWWSCLLLGLTSAVLLAGCTSGSGPSASTSPAAPTSTAVPTSPANPTPTPVSAGATTAATATSCPLVGETFVHLTMGVRLGRLTVLRAGGRVVGCRFYAQQKPNSQCGATCLAGEHLPGPNQPAVEITMQRYASSTAAHNAFVLRAGTSGGVTRTDVDGVTGLCFPTAFDPRDKGADWACTVNKGATLVLVRTVDTAHNDGTAKVLKAVLRAV